jgi:MFS family permease
MALGAIFPRLGDMQVQMGIGEGQLGMSVIGAALGVQLSLLVAGRILRAVGFRWIMVVGIMIISGAEMIASLSLGPLAFFCWLFVAGLSIGVVEVAVNVEADRTEFQIGRRVMNRCHAFWSFGFFGSGLVGALIAQLHISVFAHMAGFMIFTSCSALLLIRFYQPAIPRPGEDSQSVTFARPTKPILMLVALTLSAMLLEGAGIDWSVIFMRDVFATPPFVSGLALALVALSQFIVRFFADDFVERYGPETVTYCSVITLGVGVSLVSFAPTPSAALVGFSLLGAGTAVIFPLAISAAAQRTDRPPAVNVAALAQLSFVVFLLAPPLLGAVAEFFGIRVSFGIGLPLVVLSWFMVRSLRPST